MQPSRRRHSSTSSRRAFSLVEVLVVVGIIAIVIAVILPMLSGARNSAKKTSTVAYLTNLTSAIQQFQNDEKRLPGLWDQRTIGSSLNLGVSAMENIVLELANAVVSDTTALDAGTAGPCAELGGPQVIDINPLNGNTETERRISIAKLGSTDNRGKSYFSPDPKFFVRQCENRKQRYIQDDDQYALPDVVDAFGQPILAWVEDDLPRKQDGNAIERFAADDSNTNARARFYRFSNACFLDSDDLGKIGRDQNVNSLLGGGNGLNDDAKRRTMAAVLGNPAFPDKDEPEVPAAARAPIVFHSAGPDGLYLGKEDRGGKLAGTGGLQYQANLDPIEGGAFDDTFISSGR